MTKAPDEAPEVRIERLAAGGDGVGRLPDGRVVFVPLSAPGDRVRLRLIERRARHARGEIAELLEASPDRVEPRCDVFGACGGCTWQHVEYAAQLAAKQAIVADALQRVGRIDWPYPIEISASPQAYGYRGRARLLVEAGQVGYRRRASRALCAVSHCPVLAPALDERLARLAAKPPTRDGEWELLAAGDDARAMPLPARDGPSVVLRVAEHALRVSPGVFTQSNVLLHERLLERVLAQMGQGGAALELHAGAGFFTLGLAQRFDVLTAVESHPAAVRDLRANLAAAGHEHVEVYETDVASQAWLAPAAVVDALLVDPPRTGVPRDTLDRLLRIAPRRLVYLSCDPATLARDLGHLQRGGFALRHVEAFDLFPQTPHVEALAVLDGDPRALGAA